MSAIRESLDALARLAISRLVEDDIEGANRALSWLSFIAKDEAKISMEESDREDEPYIATWAWLVALRETLNKDRPRAVGTILKMCRRHLNKLKD